MSSRSRGRILRRLSVVFGFGLLFAAVPLPGLTFATQSVGATAEVPAAVAMTPQQVAELQAVADEPIGVDRVVAADLRLHRIEFPTRFGLRRADVGVDVGHCLAGVAQRALQFFRGQLVFQLVLDRIPLRARAAHPQPGEARGLGQALGAEYHQGDDRGQEKFGKSDIEHDVRE